MDKKSESELIKVIGNRIKQIRRALKLSQREFAKTVDMSPGYMSELETGKKVKKPSFVLFYSISQAHNVSLEFLFHGTGEMFKADKPDPPAITETKREIGKELKSIDDLIWVMKKATYYHTYVMSMAGKFFFENEELIRGLLEDDDSSNGSTVDK